MSDALMRTCRRLSNLSMVPLGAERRARLVRSFVRVSHGCGASLVREYIACTCTRAPVAWHPGRMARYLSGSAMDAALGVDKRYLVRCAHKIGCLLSLD